MEHAETTVEEFVSGELLVAAYAWDTINNEVKATKEREIFICEQKDGRDGNKHMERFWEVNQPRINFACGLNTIKFNKGLPENPFKMEYLI